MLKRFAASLKTSGSGPNKVLSSLVAILLGCAFGGMLLVVIALTVREINFASAWDGIRVVLAGVFNLGRDVNGSSALQFGFNGKLVGDMLFRATPLIMTGLSIAVSYKTGLFNIGAPGQYLAGTAAAIAVGLSVNTEVVPSWIAWLLALLAAMLAGAVWGAIPGIFKAYLNVNEVITSIMTNWIAANMVASVFDGSKFVNKIDYGKTGFTLKLATNGVATAKLGLDKLFPGSSVNAGILLTVLFAVVCWLLMSKSRVGFELRACGSNKNAAKLAGMNEKRNIVLAMAISGALAAAGSALYYLQGDIEFYWHTSMSLPAAGFNGIAVALLASCHPIGCIFGGLFMAYLSISGSQLSVLTPFNEYNASIIIAAIVYLSAFTRFFQDLFRQREQKVSADQKKETVPAKPLPVIGEDKTEVKEE